MKRVALAALLAVACSTAVYAQSSYSTVYVFGDSYSDRGRVPGIVLDQYPPDPPPPATPTSGWPISWADGLIWWLPDVTTPPPVSPYFDGRFSNGPTWAERLPKLIGVSPNPGQNYAVGGATIANFPTTNPTTYQATPEQRWSRFLRQFGGLAKVDLGFGYAANFSSSACIA